MVHLNNMIYDCFIISLEDKKAHLILIHPDSFSLFYLVIYLSESTNKGRPFSLFQFHTTHTHTVQTIWAPTQRLATSTKAPHSPIHNLKLLQNWKSCPNLGPFFAICLYWFRAKSETNLKKRTEKLLNVHIAEILKGMQRGYGKYVFSKLRPSQLGRFVRKTRMSGADQPWKENTI